MDFSNLVFRVVVDKKVNFVHVTIYAEGIPLDRRLMTGYQLSLNKMRIARRFQAAAMSGKVYKNFEIKVDINGKTYLQADCAVHPTSMSADLRKIGF